MVAKSNLLKYPLFGFLKHLPDKEKKEYGKRIFNLISDSVMDRIYQRLDKEKQKEMLGLFIKDGSEKQRKAFLEKYAPDFKSILVGESLKLKEQIENRMRQ